MTVWNAATIGFVMSFANPHIAKSVVMRMNVRIYFFGTSGECSFVVTVEDCVFMAGRGLVVVEVVAPCGFCLHKDIAYGRGFCRPDNNIESGGLGCELDKEMVFAASTHYHE